MVKRSKSNSGIAERYGNVAGSASGRGQALAGRLTSSRAMPRLANMLLLTIPVMVLCLLVGLGLAIAVLATEGRNSKLITASQVVGLVNLVLILPLGVLAWSAEARDARWMFMFVAGAFALIGLLGIRLPHRFRD